MAKDNLLLFPKKSKPVLEMTEKELRWALSGTLMLIFALSLGLNSTLFGISKSNEDSVASGIPGDRANPLASQIQIDWENRALVVLDDPDTRGLASVGQPPSPFEELSLGALEGNYKILSSSQKITQIDFKNSKETLPKKIEDRVAFLNSHLSLWGQDVRRVRQVFADASGEGSLEKFELLSGADEPIGMVQLTVDSEGALISLNVE